MRIRQIDAGDAVGILDHLLRLDPPARRLRFSGPVPDAAVRSAWARIDWSRALGHALADEADVLRGVAHLALRDDGAAEAGLSIETPWRGRGHGARLLAACLADASARGATHLLLDVLPENAPMRALASAAGGVARVAAGTLEYRFDLAPAPPARPDPTSGPPTPTETPCLP